MYPWLHGRAVAPIALFAGVGKTECALWLASPVVAAGRLWLFVSLPAVQAPFGPNALVDHLLSAYGLQGNTAARTT